MMMENLKSAGLYIHIPYCKHKCSYCNFHFSTNLSTRNALIAALNHEISQRKSEAENYLIDSIYFGGGTPSILSHDELTEIIKNITDHYKIKNNVELTVEANPDDINEDLLKGYLDLGINRLSIGVQSFYDNQLNWMNRAHDAKQSHVAIELVCKYNISNFSIDLMYGLPDGNIKNWKSNLEKVNSFQIPHLSCYALTMEERTKLFHRIKQNTLKLPDDQLVLDQMDVLFDFCEQHNYEAYEISNFAKPGFRSRHNSSYWNAQPYLGFGPSAHSFDLLKRRWNISNNAIYITSVEKGIPYWDQEVLSKKNLCNEYIMLQLRRIEGIDILVLNEKFPEFTESVLKEFKIQAAKENVIIQQNQITLSRQGKYIADEVSASAFV